MTVYTDDFTGADGAAWNAAKWTFTASGSGGSATISSNRGLLRAGGNYGSYAANVKDMPVADDQSMLVKFTPTSATAYADFNLRSTADYTTRYFLGYYGGSGQFTLQKRVAGTYTNLGTGVAVSNGTGGLATWIRFEVVGTTVRWRQWNDGFAEPSTWTQSVTDTAVVSGVASIGHTGRSGAGPYDLHVDDVTVSILAATHAAAAALAASGLVGGNAHRSLVVAAGLAGAGGLAAAAQAEVIRAAIAALSGTGVIGGTIDGSAILVAAALAGSASTSGSPYVDRTVHAPLTGSAALLLSTAELVRMAAATLLGAAVVAGDGALELGAAADLLGAGVVDGLGSRELVALATLAVSSSLAASGTLSGFTAAELVGAALVAAEAARQLQADGTLVAYGYVDAADATVGVRSSRLSHVTTKVKN